MNVKTSLTCVLGIILLLGLPVLAGSTFSVYSDPPAGNGGTILYGFNDFGASVGWSLIGGKYYGLMREPGQPAFMITPPSALDTYATGINDGNDVVGYFRDSSGTHAFLKAGGSYTTLNAPGAVSTYAYGINNLGQVVGYYVDAHGITHAFAEQGGVFKTINFPGAVATYGLGINENGDIVGSYFDGTAVHGFIYRNGTFILVDYPAAAATWVTGINDDGTVVGWAQNCAGCAVDSFLKPANGAFSAFSEGFGNTYLTDINDHGVLLSSNGSVRQVVSDRVVSAIPEPGTISLLAAGALTLALTRRFRGKK